MMSSTLRLAALHGKPYKSFAGLMVESTLFVRRESEGQRSESSTPSFMGQGLGLRPPKRTLSELGALLCPFVAACLYPLAVVSFRKAVSISLSCQSIDSMC